MKPESEDALAALVRDAAGPLAIRGGGTRAPAVAEGTIVETTGMTGITLHEPGALTLVARAGTPLAEIEAALSRENQRLAFEPMDHRRLLSTDGEPTIGGVVAANVSGPRRVTAGACRDFLLGVRFVDGRGQIVKNGGRVMKNVTGYDLVKLMCGAHGTLGILTEVSLKVLPEVESSATLVFGGLDPARAVALMSDALGSPYEVTGAAHVDGDTCIRIEGFSESVAYRAAALTQRLAQYGPPRGLDHDDSRTFWRGVRDATALADVPGNLWRISVRPSDAPGLAERIAARASLFDWGGGLIWCVTEPGTDIRAHMSEIRGHATLLRGEGFAAFHPEAAPLAAISRGLRAKFDPRGILNTGLMD